MFRIFVCLLIYCVVWLNLRTTFRCNSDSVDRLKAHCVEHQNQIVNEEISTHKNLTGFHKLLLFHFHYFRKLATTIFLISSKTWPVHRSGCLNSSSKCVRMDRHNHCSSKCMDIVIDNQGPYLSTPSSPCSWLVQAGPPHWLLLI